MMSVVIMKIMMVKVEDTEFQVAVENEKETNKTTKNVHHSI